MAALNRVHLNGLRAVESVMRLGSLPRAAEELGVSISAVSQQVGRTEAQLGRMLFLRTPAGLQPTPFGLRMGQRLAVGFRELREAVLLADDHASNTLVASVAPAFASKWLLPRLSRHFERHPDVLLRIDASTRLVDFARSDVDVAIRLGDGSWPDVNAELLVEMAIFPVCSPQIAEPLKTPADLARSWAITDENSMVKWEDWFRAVGAEPVNLLPGASFTDPMLCLESAIAGHGVMLGWPLLVADALADGRLVAPFGKQAAHSGLGYYLVTPQGRRLDAKVRDFRTWIRQEVAETMERYCAPPASGGGTDG